MRKRGKEGGGERERERERERVIWVLLILGEDGRRRLRESAGNERIEWRRRFACN
jgi:type VI protein secretion system component VasF